MSGSSRLIDSVPVSFLQQAGDALLEAFGVSFRFWENSASDTANKWNESAASPPAAPADCEEQVSDLLQQECRDSGGTIEDPRLIERDHGHWLLVLPLAKSNGRQLVATAAFEETSPRLLLQLARLFLNKWSLRQQVDRYRQDLDSCAVQIGDNFEELTFLRRLAEHLDLADASHGTWQVAQMVLPLLAPLIQAEELVLVPAHHREADSAQALVGQPAVWAGPRKVSDEACRQLIEKYAASAAHVPVVKNHLLCDLGSDRPDAVGEFILITLNKSDLVLGWLVAINRTQRQVHNTETARWDLSDGEFGTVEASLLSSVASMLGTHARNIDLFREKESLLVGVVRAMVSAIEAKDPYTCGHSERVALFAKRLARELGLDEAHCERLYLTGLLHDVGKIGISDATLHKPGSLTEEERAEVQRHPDLGWAILHDLEQLRYVIPGVVHHHERYDGRGYPDGLAGDKIPLDGRILAVADAYDAMTSDRPYRRGMEHEKAAAIFRSGAGTQWDRDMVETFLSISPDVFKIQKAYQRPAHPERQREATGSAPLATNGTASGHTAGSAR